MANHHSISSMKSIKIIILFYYIIFYQKKQVKVYMFDIKFYSFSLSNEFHSYVKYDILVRLSFDI